MLKTNVVSLSAAITAEALYIVCALAFLLFPKGALMFFDTWFHGINLTLIASGSALTFVEFIVGFVTVFTTAYVTGFVFASVYNALGKAM